MSTIIATLVVLHFVLSGGKHAYSSLLVGKESWIFCESILNISIEHLICQVSRKGKSIKTIKVTIKFQIKRAIYSFDYNKSSLINMNH